MKRYFQLCLIVLLSTVSLSAQESWLDNASFQDWNKPGTFPPTVRRMSKADAERCQPSIRPGTLSADLDTFKPGWTLVGAAQVFGKLSVIPAATAFDGMCRPLGFQYFVFFGTRYAGSLSPVQMNSRTDGALSRVTLMSQNRILAEYTRYKTGDALCCPSKMQTVAFDVVPVGKDVVLKRAQSASENGTGTVAIQNTKWRWVKTQTPVETINAAKPDNYTVNFLPDGIVQVKADCNSGRGRYTAEDGRITFTGIALTMMMCPQGTQDHKFTRGLADARLFKIDGRTMIVDLVADSGTMHFTRID